MRWYFRKVVKRVPAVTAASATTAAAVAVAVALIVAWWLPGLRGDGASDRDPDVVLVGDGELIRGSDVVSRRLREEGFSVADPVEASDWCDIADRVVDIRARVAVVVHIDPVADTTDPSCGDATWIAERILSSPGRIVVVSGIDAADDDADGVRDEVVDSLIARGSTLVDVSRLLAGVDGATSCLWWDDCVVSDEGIAYVVVRDEDGLTLAGHQRMARMIVSAVL